MDSSLYRLTKNQLKMDIKQQCITYYLTQGIGYRQLAAKYGDSRTTINKWVMIQKGIRNLPLTQKQVQYNSSAMNSVKKKTVNQLIQLL